MSHREKLKAIYDRCAVKSEYSRVYPTDMDTAWRVFTDTDHLAQLLDIGPAGIEEKPLRRGVSERTIFWAKMGQYFVEEPYVWEYGKWFGNLRKEGRGPLQTMVQLAIFDQESTGVRLTMHTGFMPNRSLKGLVFRVIGRLMSARNRRIYDAVDFEAASPMPAHQSFPVNRARLEAYRACLKETADAPLVSRLMTHLAEGIDSDLQFIAPFELAHRWGTSPDEVARLRDALLEMLLKGVREGFISLMWSLICPSCFGPKEGTESLEGLKTGAHCESCNITFGARFSESVQVTFRPAPQLRRVKDGLACVGGPRRTPHQLQVQYLAPGEVVTLDDALIFGRPHRLVLRTDDGDHRVELHEAGHYRISDDGITRDADAALRVENTTDRQLRFFVQEEQLPPWTLTGAELIRRQTFVDYFSDQVLAPDLHAEVGTVTLMFSDLVGSTRLYQREGDAGAFAAVCAHFEILKEVLNEHHGTLVKTVGDAIMAVFEHPEEAVRCGLAMQLRMQDESELGLRLGMHVGPCLAVTLNERLDYFGATVNQAARMEGQCKPGELVLSEAVQADPAVQAFIASDALQITRDAVNVKGIESTLTIYRIACR